MYVAPNYILRTEKTTRRHDPVAALPPPTKQRTGTNQFVRKRKLAHQAYVYFGSPPKPEPRVVNLKP